MFFLANDVPQATDVHVCPACREPFVVPADVIAVLPGGEGYVMELVCRNCEHVQVGRFSEDAMTALDMHLDVTFAQIAEAASWMERMRIEREVEDFAAALHQGHVLPEDF